MVKKDSPLKTVADLTARPVAIVAMKTMQHAAFLLWVDKHGGDSKSIKLIEIPFPEMIGALDSGRVDAAIPRSRSPRRDLRPTAFSAAYMPRCPRRFWSSVFFATDTWLNAHPDLAVKFAGADSAKRRSGPTRIPKNRP